MSAATRLAILNGHEAHAIEHLRALATGARAVRNEGYGVCYELAAHAYGLYGGYVVVAEYSSLWPVGTGDGPYPIPHYLYHKDAGTLWVGEQLEKRLQLCAFIADQIESDMKEVQNESQQ